MRGSPCSPPSACRTSWGWPLRSCQMYVDAVAKNGRTKGRQVLVAASTSESVCNMLARAMVS